MGLEQIYKKVINEKNKKISELVKAIKSKDKRIAGLEEELATFKEKKDE